ncbi:MAG: hypothetical protein QOG43_1846 [Actinomycetota bacterium]|jgi:hypothetical protein|nr:hypothetical protein [Actinomycetota bacterium]
MPAGDEVPRPKPSLWRVLIFCTVLVVVTVLRAVVVGGPFWDAVIVVTVIVIGFGAVIIQREYGGR